MKLDEEMAEVELYRAVISCKEANIPDSRIAEIVTDIESKYLTKMVNRTLDALMEETLNG